MPSNVLLPAFLILTGAITLVPIMENSGTRTIIYWLVLPPLLAGLIVIMTQLGGLRS